MKKLQKNVSRGNDFRLIIGILIGIVIVLTLNFLKTSVNKPRLVSNPQSFAENAPNLNLPLSYFPKEDMEWGDYEATKDAYGVFGGESVSQSYPTTNITLKDYLVENRILPVPKTLADLTSSGQYVEYVRENYQKYGTLAASFLPDQYIVTKEEFDVDLDGRKETILGLGLTVANHPPQTVKIIKDDKVIFSFEGFQPMIKSVTSNNGFYLEWIDDSQLNQGACCPTGKMRTRFVYENTLFKPAWEQEVIYTKVGKMVQ